MISEGEMWDQAFNNAVNETAEAAIEQFLTACFAKDGFDRMFESYKEDLAFAWGAEFGRDDPVYPSIHDPEHDEKLKAYHEAQERHYAIGEVIDQMGRDLEVVEDIQRAFALSVVERALEYLANRSYIELMG